MDNPRRPSNGCPGFLDHDHSICPEAVRPSTHGIPSIKISRPGSLNAEKEATVHPSSVVERDSRSRNAKNQDKKLPEQSLPEHSSATITATRGRKQEETFSSTRLRNDTDGQKIRSAALRGKIVPKGAPRPRYSGPSRTPIIPSGRSQPLNSATSQSSPPSARNLASSHIMGLVESQTSNSLTSSNVPLKLASMYGGQRIHEDTPSNSGVEPSAADYRILFPGFSLLASEWGSRTISELEADIESYYQRHPSMVPETAVYPMLRTNMTNNEVEEFEAFLLTWRQCNARKYEAQAFAQHQRPAHQNQIPNPLQNQYPPQLPRIPQSRGQPVNPSVHSNTNHPKYGLHLPTFEPPTSAFGDGPNTAMLPLGPSSHTTLPTTSSNRAQPAPQTQIPLRAIERPEEFAQLPLPEQSRCCTSNAAVIPQRRYGSNGDTEAERQQYPQPPDRLNMFQQILTYRDLKYEPEEVAREMQNSGYSYMTVNRIRHYFEFYRLQGMWVNGEAVLPPF